MIIQLEKDLEDLQCKRDFEEVIKSMSGWRRKIWVKARQPKTEIEKEITFIEHYKGSRNSA